MIAFCGDCDDPFDADLLESPCCGAPGYLDEYDLDDSLDPDDYYAEDFFDEEVELYA